MYRYIPNLGIEIEACSYIGICVGMKALSIEIENIKIKLRLKLKLNLGQN